MEEKSLKRRKSSLLEGSDLPEEITKYLEQHKIESILTKAFNDVITRLPIDPFSEICSILKSHAPLWSNTLMQNKVSSWRSLSSGANTMTLAFLKSFGFFS